MKILETIFDAVIGRIIKERKRRREDPCGTRDMFLERAAFWQVRGRKRRVKANKKKAAKWDLLCRQKQSDCDKKGE